MLETGEAHAPASLEVVVEIASQRPAKSSDEGEQPAVGAVLQQDTMELLVELDTPGDVTPGLLQPPDDVGETLEAGRIRGGRLVERERLERGEDGADLAKLGPVEGGEAESSARLRRQQSFAGETEKGFPHGGAADPELAGDGGIANPRSAGDGALLNALKDLEIDLVAER
jgi:hypothetical protein